MLPPEIYNLFVEWVTANYGEGEVGKLPNSNKLDREPAFQEFIKSSMDEMNSQLPFSNFAEDYGLNAYWYMYSQYIDSLVEKGKKEFSRTGDYGSGLSETDAFIAKLKVHVQIADVADNVTSVATLPNFGDLETDWNKYRKSEINYGSQPIIDINNKTVAGVRKYGNDYYDVSKTNPVKITDPEILSSFDTTRQNELQKANTFNNQESINQLTATGRAGTQSVADQEKLRLENQRITTQLQKSQNNQMPTDWINRFNTPYQNTPDSIINGTSTSGKGDWISKWFAENPYNGQQRMSYGNVVDMNAGFGRSAIQAAQDQVQNTSLQYGQPYAGYGMGDIPYVGDTMRGYQNNLADVQKQWQPAIDEQTQLRNAGYMDTPQTYPNAPATPEWLTKFVPTLQTGKEISPQNTKVASGQTWNRTTPTQKEMLGGYLQYAGVSGKESLNDYQQLVDEMLPKKTWQSRIKTARQI
jgi:hypothetical protein